MEDPVAAAEWYVAHLGMTIKRFPYTLPKDWRPENWSASYTAAEGTKIDLQTAFPISGTPATPIVRVERADRLRIGRVLDLGAAGVMVPQVQTVDEARLLAASLRYQPGGIREIGRAHV